MTESGVDRSALTRNRSLWADVSDQLSDREAEDRWNAEEIGWGLFKKPESALGVLGEVDGLDVIELGCGTASLSAQLAQRGARPVGVDLSRNQLLSARRLQQRFGTKFDLLEASADEVPLRSSVFDLAVSEYGAAPWCRPESWLAEAARLLVPGGRLVFLTNSVLAGMCVPAEGGFAGNTLLRPQEALRDIEWPGGGIEHHPSHGDWIRHLTLAGFEIEALHELCADERSTTPEFYEIVTTGWAQRWPAEDLWVARLG